MAERTLKVEVVGDTRSLEKAFGRAGKSAGGLGRSFSTLGKTAALGIAGLAVSSGFLGKKMIGLASDAAEVESKFKVIFAKEMPGMVKNLDAFSKATGASRFELREQVADMGALLEPLTKSKAAAGDLSIQFTKLATDLGSFNNVPVADALLAIRSGLVGEAEPLRRFGVLLNEGAVKAEAYRSGIAKAGSELTEQQKVQARANLIMKQTALAQGDATRTAGSFANQLKGLKNGFKDLGTDAGKFLLPLATTAVSALSGFVSDLSAAKGFKAKLNVVWTHVQEAGGKIVEVLRAAIAGIDWQAVWAGAEGIAAGFASRLEAVDWTSVGSKVMEGLSTALEKTAELGKRLSATVMSAIREVNWTEAGKIIGPGLAAAVVTGFVTLTDPMFWIRNWELALGVAAVAFAGPIGRLASKLVAPLVKLGGDLVASIGVGILDAAPRIGPVIIRVLSAIPALVLKVLSPLTGLVSGLFGKLGGLAQFSVKVLGLAAVFSQLGQWAADVYRWLTGLKDRVTGFFAGAGTWLQSAGRDVIAGLWAGMAGAWSGLVSWATGAVRGLVNSLMENLMFWKSPPEAFGKEVTGRLVMGMVSGIGAGIAPLNSKMTEAVKKAMEAARQAVVDARGTFASAFDGLASAALAAFDKLSSDFQTKTEKKIAAQDERRAAAERQGALTGAQAELATAVAGGDPAVILAAEKAVADAKFAIKRAADEKDAARERQQYEAKRERQRMHLENELGALAAQAEKTGMSADNLHKRVLGIFKRYEVPLKDAATKVGAVLAAGLREGMKDAKRAAQELADAIRNQLGAISVVVKVHVAYDSSGNPSHRQHGGPVEAGRGYVVGEKGPEFFIPGRSGNIIPNGGGRMAMAGGGNVNHFHFPNYVGSRQELVQAMQEEVGRFVRNNGGSFFPGG